MVIIEAMAVIMAGDTLVPISAMKLLLIVASTTPETTVPTTTCAIDQTSVNGICIDNTTGGSGVDNSGGANSTTSNIEIGGTATGTVTMCTGANSCQDSNLYDSCHNFIRNCTYGCNGTSECQSAPTPIVSTLTARPSIVPVGGSCTLIWNVQHISSCTLSGVGINHYPITPDGSGNNASSTLGGALNTSSVYTLTCYSGSQTVSTTTTCVVNPSFIEY